MTQYQPSLFSYTEYINKTTKLADQQNHPDNSFDWWPSPAKLNLFLHICGRYDNGYHQLQTVFQLLDYGDLIGFRVNDSEKVTLIDNIDKVRTEDNLIYRAAIEMFARRPSNCKLGVDIKIDKRIPMGGGLGGGSSNAATTLVALNAMFRCKLSSAELQEIGLGLGADVPVFVFGKTAFANGIGEKLSPMPLETQVYLVACPSAHLSTESVFTHPDLPRNTPLITANNYQFEHTKNDCEKLVCDLEPKVANLLQQLLHYAPSRLTGTGASVFARFSCTEEALAVQEKLPKDCISFVTKGVNHSALHDKLQTYRHL